MTEFIKQWIEDQRKEDLKNFTFSRSKEYGYRVGLTKGIEIAEGFAEWLDNSPYYLFGSNNWQDVEKGQPNLTTSQLLEKYLEYINKSTIQK